MVSGRAFPVTKVPAAYQCAETETTAVGRGRSPARERKPRLHSLSWMAFRGEPCPTKRTGMRRGGRPGVLLSLTTALGPPAAARPRTAFTKSRRVGPAIDLFSNQDRPTPPARSGVRVRG